MPTFTGLWVDEPTFDDLYTTLNQVGIQISHSYRPPKNYLSNILQAVSCLPSLHNPCVCLWKVHPMDIDAFINTLLIRKEKADSLTIVHCDDITATQICMLAECVNEKLYIRGEFEPTDPEYIIDTNECQWNAKDREYKRIITLLEPLFLSEKIICAQVPFYIYRHLKKKRVANVPIYSPFRPIVCTCVSCVTNMSNFEDF